MDAKRATTDFAVIEAWGASSGRACSDRWANPSVAHMAEIGHPIVGDGKPGVRVGRTLAMVGAHSLAGMSAKSCIFTRVH